ncbi:hypothetical protein DFH11DRAFT_1627687 [Phellopilus nigrolimitatus]|nr:hypothetical protein DFH11DRAFT_1627687 [Phellopilus nigrolimitatus]
MTLSAFVWSICLFWAVVYAVRAFCVGQSQGSLLPTARAASTRHSKHLRTGTRSWKFSVQNFHLKAQTSALNACHDALVDFLELPYAQPLRHALRMFYDVGSVCGTVGMFLGIAVLALTCFQLLSLALATNDAASGHNLVKRSIESSKSSTASQPILALNPIIPGVTVPWSHLPVLLFALFVAQCIHEAGHAAAAAIDSLPLHAIGASITIVLPSAFVSLSPSLKSLPAVSRLRIVAAGAWHNLLLWGLIYLASIAGAGSLWSAIGWSDVQASGLVVLGIEEYSSLAYHLVPGSIVTALDDAPLGGQDTTPEFVWSRYLLIDQVLHKSYEHGWCFEASVFSEQPTDCCIPSRSVQPPSAQLSCFVPTQDGDQGHCVDPVPVLVPSSVGESAGPSHTRCFSASDCIDHRDEDGKGKSRGRPMECIRPDVSAQLLRITIAPPIWAWEERDGHGSVENETKTVLWSGPREEVWEQVKTGTFAPRSNFLPLWLPSSASLFFEYLSTLSLSLYIFNLFALPFLDGAYFLSELLDYMGASRDTVGLALDVENGPSDSDSSFTAHTAYAAPSSSTTGEPNFGLRFAHPRLLRAEGRLWTWRRIIRGRKVGIERGLRYVTIGLMGVAVFGMAWSWRG